MRIHLRVICIAMLLVLAACSKSDQGAPEVIKSPSPAVGDPVPLNGEVISCETGDDCEVLELGCCDHCNGGFAVSVNAEFASEVAERNCETCDDDFVCTSMDCPALHPKCIDGECAYADEVSLDWQYCEADDDCVVIELGCCDHCNGGRVVAANREFEDDVKEDMADVCEEDHPCTLMACAEELAACEEGMCTHHPDPDFGPAE